MKKTANLVVALALAAICVLPAAAQGEEGGGWKLPSLNPFKSKSGPPTSARVSDEGGWKMPKIWSSSSSAAKPKGPSVWQKMTAGTKSAFSKTADALNPFDDAQDNQPTLVTGSRNKFRNASAKKDEKTGSWFPSMWGAKEEDERPKTVTDFLKQPRVQP